MIFLRSASTDTWEVQALQTTGDDNFKMILPREKGQVRREVPMAHCTIAGRRTPPGIAPVADPSQNWTELLRPRRHPDSEPGGFKDYLVVTENLRPGSFPVFFAEKKWRDVEFPSVLRVSERHARVYLAGVS